MLTGNLHKTQVTLQPQTSRGAQDRSRAMRPVGLGTRPPTFPTPCPPAPARSLPSGRTALPGCFSGALSPSYPRPWRSP